MRKSSRSQALVVEQGVPGGKGQAGLAVVGCGWLRHHAWFLAHLNPGSGGREETGWTVYPGREVLVILQTPSGLRRSPQWRPPPALEWGDKHLSFHREQFRILI